MIVQSVVLHGFRELYEIFYEIYKDGSTTHYEEKLLKRNLMENLSIFIHLEEMTPFDYYVLKRFAGQNIQLCSYTRIDEDSATEMSQEERDLIVKHDSLEQNIAMQADKTVSTGLIHFPFLERVSCNLHWKGGDIYGFFRASSMFDVFNDWLKGITYTPGITALPLYTFPSAVDIFDKQMSMFHPVVSLEDYIINHLFKEYFTFFKDIIIQTKVDLISTKFITKYNHQDCGYGEFNLLDIQTPAGCLYMSGDPKYAEKMDDIKVWVGDPLLNGNNVKGQTFIGISTKLSFGTFLKLNLFTPYQFIVDSGIDTKSYDPNTLLKPSDIQKFEVRLKGFGDSLAEYRKNLIAKGDALKACEFYIYGSAITFTMRGNITTYESVLEILNNLIEQEEEDAETSLYVSELTRLSETISMYLTVVYASIGLKA